MFSCTDAKTYKCMYIDLTPSLSLSPPPFSLAICIYVYMHIHISIPGQMYTCIYIATTAPAAVHATRPSADSAARDLIHIDTETRVRCYFTMYTYIHTRLHMYIRKPTTALPIFMRLDHPQALQQDTCENNRVGLPLPLSLSILYMDMHIPTQRHMNACT